MEPLTPMMMQYMDVKKDYKDCILMYRLGDFFEMFFDDAITASRELELTLTGRDCGREEKAPMCGVPHHAVQTYIARLISKGYKVAVCEQMEDPALAKGIVKRDGSKTNSANSVRAEKTGVIEYIGRVLAFISFVLLFIPEMNPMIRISGSESYFPLIVSVFNFNSSLSDSVCSSAGASVLGAVNWFSSVFKAFSVMIVLVFVFSFTV